MLIDEIKLAPITTETFEELIKDASFEGWLVDGIETLNMILKSEVGGILDKTNPTPKQISEAARNLRYLFKHLQALALFQNEQFILSNPEFRGILALVSDVNSLSIEDHVMETFEFWCFDDTELARTREYALKLTLYFNILIAVLIESNRVAEKLFNAKSKKEVADEQQ